MNLSQDKIDEAVNLLELQEDSYDLDEMEMPDASPIYEMEEFIDEERDSKAMSDSEIITEVYKHIDSGQGGSDSSNATDYTTPLEYYKGTVPGLSPSEAKDPNTSEFVSKDVAMAIDSTIAEISELFAVDEICLFTPTCEQDEDQAQSETELLNSLFFNEYNGYTLLQRAIKDCLLHRNASAKVYWDERITVAFDEYENVNPLMLPELLQPESELQKVEVVEQIFDNETEMVTLEDEVIDFNSESTVTVRVKRTTIEGKPVVDIVKPENVIVSADHCDPTLSSARFVGYEHNVYQSELIAQGFDPDVVAKLSEHNSSEETSAREREGTSEYYSSPGDKLVRIYECYIQLDADGDDISELRKIIVGNHNMLYNEPVESKAIIGGVTKISPHSHSGISLYDDMFSIQDSKTNVMRSIINGTRLSSNPRIGVVPGAVNIDDLLTSRTGGVVRIDNPGAIVPIPSNEVPQSSFGFIELMDSVRRDRGGSAIDTASQAQQIAGQTAHGIERTMSALEQGNLTLARTFAETFVRDLFQELHNVIRTYHPGEITAKVKGNWITQTPSHWQKRTGLIISLSGSKTQRANKISSLMGVIAYQEKLSASGSILFSEDKLYKALTQVARLGGIDNPNQYYVDPQSKEGKEASAKSADAKAKAKQKNDEADARMQTAQEMFGQAEAMKGQASIMSAKGKFETEQMSAKLESLQMIVDKREKDSQLAYNYDKVYIDNAVKLAIEEMKADASGNEEVTNNLDTLQAVADGYNNIDTI